MLDKVLANRRYVLIAAGFMLLFACYELAFKKTLEAWHIRQQLRAQMAQSADLTYEPAYLERKNRNLGKILGLYKTDTAAFRSSIISTISSIAARDQVKLTEVPTTDALYRTPEFSIQKLTFQGDFFALTRLLYELQSTRGIGVIRSVDYKMSTDRVQNMRGRKTLMSVYLETVNEVR
ncbi:MAG: hypothetical protein JWP94_2867 [Mucilaginibacter sp.]|nr:hypothetical protein [Mucilaginibacter sp.]